MTGRIRTLLILWLFPLIGVWSQNSFQTKTPVTEHSRWQIGIHGGGSYMLGSTANEEKSLQSLGLSSKEAKDYAKDWRNGYHFAGDVYYMFNSQMGAGVKYSLFTYEADKKLTVPFLLNDYLSQVDFLYISFNTMEKAYVNYIGPSFMMHQWLNKSQTLDMTGEISVGYAHIRDEVRFGETVISGLDNTLSTGSAFAADVTYMFAYHPAPWLSVGFRLGFFRAVFSKLNVDNGSYSYTAELEKDNYQNASSLNYSLGVQFHF
jgi:hypothetical protein